MALTAGTRLGPYEIVELLGAGGRGWMGRRGGRGRTDGTGGTVLQEVLGNQGDDAAHSAACQRQQRDRDRH